MKALGRVYRLWAIPALLVLLAAPTGSALAQYLPIEIPFVHEWASSPHARPAAEAFNHWEGEIPTRCAKCHSTIGFRDYLGDDGSTPWKVDKASPVGTFVACVACHNNVTRTLTTVTFPSGVTLKDLGPKARCITCHQGRQSTPSVNKHLGDKPDDVVDKKIRFQNIHYRAAGATRYGTLVKGGYEYATKEYAGFHEHDEDFQGCVECHDSHTTRIDVQNCGDCHRKVKKRKDFKSVRKSKQDFDGDGDVKDGVGQEVDALHARLNEAIMAYGKAVAKTPIVYDSHQYPYFFTDKNGNGKSDNGEAKYGNRYKTWTPRLLRAAYNYQYVAKDPGAYAHNPAYTVQLLHGSLADLGTKVKVDMAGMARPSP